MAGNKDRERRRARERYERQRAQRLERQRKMRTRATIGLVAIVVAGLIAGGLVLFTGGSPKSQAAAKSTPTASASPSASPSPAPIAEPATHCTYTKTGVASKAVSAPPATPDYTATYQATINTNRGKIVINLLNSKATCAVNSFVHLADANFWNNSQCHRLSNTSPLYMLQCGDAYATASTKLDCSSTSKVGTGGPGYEFASENLTGATYPAGTVAMANAGAGTNGSQFFLVYQNSTLPAQFTPFGTIVSGTDILQNVGKAGYSCNLPGGAGGGAPKDKVVIDSVTIKKT